MANIKIFVSHRIDKDCETFDNPMFVNVRCGAYYDKHKDAAMIGDDTGDNISIKHPYLSELTVQYWAWKNQEADYYGLCHYRRYWNFSSQDYPVDAYFNVCEDYISAKTQKKYCLDADTMRSVIEANDVVTVKPINVRKLPGHYRSIKEHFICSNPYLRKHDFEVMEDVIKDLQPEYWEIAKNYFEGNMCYFCNMGIMKADIFNEYCAWLYPLLSEIEARLDVTNYCEEGLRTLGHLAERLYGVYLLYLKGRKIKIKELQTIVFQHPEKIVLPDVRENSIKLFFASNNTFVAPLSVAIKSVLSHLELSRAIDIIVLASDISAQNQKLLNSMCTQYPNAELYFLNVLPMIDGYELKAHNHISVETFFRFLIQDIIPSCPKALYLDADIIVKSDISELYDTDIEGYILAAAKDPDFIGQVNGAVQSTREYAMKTLGLNNPYNYFQAGVILFNLSEMRKEHPLAEWLELASEDFRYSDQDVLNKYCENRIKFMDMRWNVLFNCDDRRIPCVIKYAPKEVFDTYMEARKEPFIIHFGGGTKPWHKLPVDFFEEFWAIARQTPYYEQFIYNLAERHAWFVGNYHYQVCHTNRIKRVVSSVKHFPRKVVDFFFPVRTNRREKLKRILRKCKILTH